MCVCVNLNLSATGNTAKGLNKMALKKSMDDKIAELTVTKSLKLNSYSDPITSKNSRLRTISS